MNGTIFDIAEGSIHDGPGLRVTVFLKGCPLRCTWCHSPEGQSIEPELLHLPDGRIRQCGQRYSSVALANHLNQLMALLPDGGITFSGGEPLAQALFLQEVLAQLHPTHTLLDTCGYAGESEFLAVVQNVSQVFFGLKLLDPANAIHWTGRSCEPVLRNLRHLDAETDTRYRLRIPLLHEVTDTPEHWEALSALCRSLHRLERIDFLPSNPDAGAKYASCGRRFTPGFPVFEPAAPPNWFLTEFNCKQLKANEIE